MFDGMVEGMLRVNDTPSHGRRAGTVFLYELRGMRTGLRVDQVGYVTLLPELDPLWDVANA